MNLRLISVLLRKEILQGPKDYLFVMVFVAPVVITLVFSAAFGTLFAHTPTLGVADMGSSDLVPLIETLPSVDSTLYATEAELTDAVARGAVDSGLVLAGDFDSTILKGEKIELPIYFWGESLAQDRLILRAAVTSAIRNLVGQEAPVAIKSISLGDEENIPWSDRMLPFVVLMTVAFAGLGLSGMSLVNEKEKRTIGALAITPATMREIFLTKAMVGTIIGTFMGVVILIMNRALGEQPGLLIMLLFLGSAMASGIGLLMAALFDDSTTFFAGMKGFGIFLYAPAFVYMFPGIPHWIGNIFPTYYIVEPIVEISQRGGGWSAIAVDTIILIGLNVLLVAALGITVHRKPQYAV